MRALNTNQPSQGTFFDDATPVDRTREIDTERNQLRDSHDLSFAEAGVRDSVVDNMLLSLDQFSTGTMFSSSGSQYAQYGEDDFFLRDNSFRPPGPRHRGHTYTSSRSSDYDLNPDEPTRYAANHGRSRRSNSSNTIGLPMSRKGSAREPLSGRQPNGPYGQYQQTGHLRGTGKKSSKGSGSSSMDFGQAGILGNSRLGFGKRSASFDQSNYGDRSRTSPVKVESVLDRGRTAYQNYADDYNAAPEPTIPAGPRRMQEVPQPPAYPSQPPLAPPQASEPRRRGSIRSNTSYKTLRKNKSQLEPNMRVQAQEFVNASTLRDLPPVPSLHDPSAPSPSVNTRKGLFPTQPPVATPKERPGFFRRVFGGSSSKSQPPLSNTSSASYSSPMESPASVKQSLPDIDSIYSQTRPRTTPSNSSHIANQIKAMPRNQQAGLQSQKDTQPPVPPVLAKKPSSFFRRRKKSISENTKPPVMTLDFSPPPKPVIPAQPSPGVSSLRKVMNPYLNDGTRAGEHLYDSREAPSEDTTNNERSHGFSPGYRPHKDATMRTVKANSRSDDRTPPFTRGDQVMLTHLASADSPKMKLKVKHNKVPSPMPQEDTFLADSSSCNEDRSGRASPTGERSGVDEGRRPSTCPTTSSVHQSGSEGKSDKRTDGPTELLFPVPPNRQPRKSSLGGSASQSASEVEVEEEGWILTQTSRSGLATPQDPSRDPSPAAKRVWLDTTIGEDGSDDLKLPLEGARSSQKSLLDSNSPVSPDDVFHSATSLPIVQVENRDADTMPAIVEDRSMHTEPTDADRERAFQIFNGDDSSIQKAQAATVLGDVTLGGTRTRKAFMDLFDWTGFNILGAMRDMCGKLVLKAETQQVDRILMSLSERWCECNPNHGFKAVGEFLYT
jgi:hypothetical protein